MAGTMSFQALIPTFIAEWRLSHAEAGWISGAAYAGYMAGVPLLVSLTDRIDARRIVLLFCLVACLSSLGFALFAEGVWSALAFRVLNGLALAGTYMPGLKALTDRIEGPSVSRYQSLYTATFSIGIEPVAAAGRAGRRLARLARGLRRRRHRAAARRPAARLAPAPGGAAARRAQPAGAVRLPAGAAQPRGDGLHARLRRPLLGAVRLSHLAGRLHGVRRRRRGRREHDQPVGDGDPDARPAGERVRQRARQPLRPPPHADRLHAGLGRARA